MSERKTMIYTIQTLSGEEQYVSRFMDRLLEPGMVTDKFIPMRDLPRKIQGEWVKKTERLFPGYLFVETPDPDGLFFCLKKVPKLSKILADGEYNFYCLTEEENEYIRKIGASRHDHVFGISQVSIDDTDPLLPLGERVWVVNGDLLEFQGDIVRYDLHHRKAFLRTDLFGGSEICVGLELIKQL